MHVVKALTADLQREGRRENAIDVLGPRLCAVGRQSSDVRWSVVELRWWCHERRRCAHLGLDWVGLTLCLCYSDNSCLCVPLTSAPFTVIATSSIGPP